MEDRRIILLSACKELLEKQEDSSYVLDLLSESIYYDEVECNGAFLLKEIKIELDDFNYEEKVSIPKSLAEDIYNELVCCRRLRENEKHDIYSVSYTRKLYNKLKKYTYVE